MVVTAVESPSTEKDQIGGERAGMVGRSYEGSVEVPVIDFRAAAAGGRLEVAKQIVEACEKYGFFKVINHGVPADTVASMEQESVNFFGKPLGEKEQAGPANPFGYGCKNIGFNGDFGQLEYLLLKTNPLSISQISHTISSRDPLKFSYAVSGYVEAVRELACELLDLMAEGLRVPDRAVFSRMIRAVDSDSILRLNHYPTPPPIAIAIPTPALSRDSSSSSPDYSSSTRVGFGEHCDPQILTILRSNDVGGLHILLPDGAWVPVPPDPTAFCVNVGDVLQVLTNGRFLSVRHKALTNSDKSRMSVAYFAAPPLHAKITALPEMITPKTRSLYRPFTWEEFKKAAYSLRLGDSRLDLFRMLAADEQTSS